MRKDCGPDTDHSLADSVGKKSTAGEVSLTRVRHVRTKSWANMFALVTAKLLLL